MPSDPSMVKTFIANLDYLDNEVTQINLPTTNPWGIESSTIKDHTSARVLEHVQPTLTYDRALRGDSAIQRELYSAFEFARAERYCLTERDILVFMGSKLQNLVTFDAAIFFIADLDQGVIRGKHVLGTEATQLLNRTLRLEEKLSGWVAANNQSLTNIPPFPDFRSYPDPKPEFENACIVPLNKEGIVLGAITLYRRQEGCFFGGGV